MDSNIEPERRLVAQILSAQAGSAREFYQRYHQPLKRFVISRTKCPEDAEEIVQDVFLSAIDSLALFSGAGSLMGWLYGIARHEISDYYRKKRIKTLIVSHVPVLEDLLQDHTWTHYYDRIELQQQIESVFNRLLPRYAKILKMKYLEGWSVVDIAYQLHESFKATETALFRARKAFILEWNKTSQVY